MAQLIKIDSEIIRCKQRLDEIISSFDTKVKNANEKINEAALNLYQGSGSTAINPLVEPIKNLSNNSSNIISEMIINLKNVSQFIEEQMQGYNTSQEEAKNSLIKLISLMQSLLNGSEIIGGNSETIVNDNIEGGNSLNETPTNDINDNDNTDVGTGGIVDNSDNSSEEVIEENSNQSSEYEIKNPDYQNMQIKEVYKLSEPMASTYDEYAYNAGAESYVSELIGERMGTVDELNKRMDLIVGSYNYYKEMGYSDEMIAGMLGNMCQESTFNLHDDITGNGQGIYQWVSGRAPAALDLNTQLDHSVYEINNRTFQDGQTVWDKLQNCSTVEEYAKTFAKYFEGDNSTDGIFIRQKYADAMYYLIKNGFKTE